jgi:hypothetical protein
MRNKVSKLRWDDDVNHYFPPIVEGIDNSVQNTFKEDSEVDSDDDPWGDFFEN